MRCRLLTEFSLPPAICLAVYLLALIGSANAATYTTFTVPGAKSTRAVSINNAGMVAGAITDGQDVDHGFVRAVDGTITIFDPPGALETQPVEIDNNGTIVGNYYESGFIHHGFSRAADGTITTVDPPRSQATFVRGIGGDIVGVGEHARKAFGFLRSKRGWYKIFEYPGSRDTSPHDVNIGGTVVGIYGRHQHGFVRYPDGTFESLNFGRGSTWPVAINRDGVIVGDTNYFDVFVRAVDGTVTLFTVAGADATEAAGINANGTVVGTYYAGEQDYAHGFIWTFKSGLTLFDVPDSIGTTSAGINNSGEVTGTYSNQDGSSGSFVRTE